MTDLWSYYDCQLLNFTSIIEELISIERQSIKLFTKVLPVFKYFISTGFGISKTFYGGQSDSTGRTEQGIKLSKDVCRNKSSLVIKQPENK